MPVVTTKRTKKQKAQLITKDSEHFCERCERYIDYEMNCAYGRVAEPSKRKRAIEITIVGESPGSEEVERGKFFVGRSGRELDDWLHEAGINPKTTWLDNAVRCSFQGEFKRLTTQVRNIVSKKCRPYLLSEVEEIAPKVIVALGNTALKSLAGVSGMRRWRGRIIKHRQLNCYVVPTWHPAAILQGYSQERAEAIKDLELAHSLLKKPIKWKRLKPVFVQTKEQFEKCMDEIEAADHFVLDIETNGRKEKKNQIGIGRYTEGAFITGITLSTHVARGYFVPLTQLKEVMKDEPELFESSMKLVWNPPKKSKHIDHALYLASL